MENLLRETLEVLALHNKSPDQVRWVGSKDGAYVTTWEQFQELADYEYDYAFGYPLGVPVDLVVVGDDWWLERFEVDGSEWWQFMTLPKPVPDPLPLRTLKASGENLFDDTILERHWDWDKEYWAHNPETGHWELVRVAQRAQNTIERTAKSGS